MCYMISCKFSEFPFELCRKRAFNRAKKAFFLESCKNITIRLPCIAGFLCRAIFRGCAEIEIFGEIFTSVCPLNFPLMALQCEGSFAFGVNYRVFYFTGPTPKSSKYKIM